MKKILITGSHGFLGNHLVNYYKNLNWKIYESNKIYNSLNKKFNPNLYPKEKIDYIIHCAVKTAPLDYCRKSPGEQFLINTQITNEILNFWYNYQPQAKFITFGSSCAYDPNLIKTENNYLIGECEPGYETYGYIKRYLLNGLKALNKQYRMCFSYLIPSLMYGPGFHMGDRHFIYDVLNKLIDAKKTGTPPVFWGDGEQRREIIYIDDVLKIINNSLTQNNEILNISSGCDYSIREYIEIISKLINYNGEIKWDINAFVGAKSKNLINTHLKNFTFTPVPLGLSKTIEYIESKK